MNKRGYNKFLEISKDIEVVISEEKIAEDCQWDGLKGYITNTDLDAERVIAEYHGLWVVERAFRVSKGTLEMRPMFHFTERRIEAHVCICFIAYKVLLLSAKHNNTEHISGAKKNGERPVLREAIERCKVEVQNQIPDSGMRFSVILLISELSRLGRNAFLVLETVK